MKVSSSFITILLFLVSFARMTPAQPVSSEPSGAKLTNSNLTDSFNSSWERFHFGGDLTLESKSIYQQTRLGQLSFNQELQLYINALIDNHLSASIKLDHYGGWGQYSAYPMKSPLQLDEAVLRWNYPTFQSSIGRFHFSPSPLGLISDFTVVPIEGAIIQKSFGNFHAIGLYSRVYTILGADTGTVETADDYWAFRCGWSDRNSVYGFNWAPNGIAGETSFSVDWSYEWPNQKIVVEAAWRSFTAANTQLNVVRAPGLLVSYGKVSHNSYYQVKAGYFAKNFEPQYSSLAHISGDNREWFVPNSQGIEFFLKNQVKPGWFWENRFLLYQPVVEYGATTLNYRLASAIIKNFTPLNQLKLGCDVKKDYAGVDGTHFHLVWSLRF
jgi:hypothetical protein